MKVNLASSRLDLVSKIDFDILFQNLETAFLGLKNKETIQPNQITLVAPNNDDCIIYSAADFNSNIVGVKLSPYIAARIAQKLNPVTAFTILLSMNTGEPLLICNSYDLTAIRTAATTILAVSKLKPSLNKLAIIGFGAIGQEHLRCAIRRLGFNIIHIYSPSLSTNIEKGLEILKVNKFDNASNIHFVNNLDTAICDADVVMLCTSSKTSILDIESTSSNSIITSIVTNSPTAHEITPSSLLNCDIYVDLYPNSINVAGEFEILRSQNKFDKLNIIGDLSDLCLGVDIVRADRRRYFRSVGLGIEDIVIANCII